MVGLAMRSTWLSDGFDAYHASEPFSSPKLSAQFDVLYAFASISLIKYDCAICFAMC